MELTSGFKFGNETVWIQPKVISKDVDDARVINLWPKAITKENADSLPTVSAIAWKLEQLDTSGVNERLDKLEDNFSGTSAINSIWANKLKNPVVFKLAGDISGNSAPWQGDEDITINVSIPWNGLSGNVSTEVLKYKDNNSEFTPSPWAASKIASSDSIELTLNSMYKDLQSQITSLGAFALANGKTEQGLPDVDNPDEKHIYLVKVNNEGPDKYEEWIYSNKIWVLIGEASISFENFLNKDTVKTTFKNAEYVTNGYIPSMKAVKDGVNYNDNTKFIEFFISEN